MARRRRRVVAWPLSLGFVSSSSAEGGLALKRALARARTWAPPSDAAVAVATGEAAQECESFVDVDLRHVASRASAACYLKAQLFYCDRVRLAEAASRRLLPAGRPEDRCPAGGGGRFSRWSGASEDISMRLEVPRRASVAYLILSHDRFTIVRRLVKRLYDPEHSLILVHVDTKVATPERLADFRDWARKSFLDGASRVRVFSEFSVHRGGLSMLEVQLRALEMLLVDPTEWDFYINLSDSHYVVEASVWMGTYLWLHKGANYARITSTKYYDPTLQGGRDATYDGPRKEDVYIACDRALAFECEGRLYSLTPGTKYPPVLSGVTAASGPEWVVLSRGFTEYVHRGVAEGPESSGLVRAIYDDLAALSIPEETFFQTVLMSSPFCKTLVRHDFLYLDLYDAPWRTSPDSDFPFQSPRALNATHLADLGRDEPWFARKVDDSPGSDSFRRAIDTAAAVRASWAAPAPGVAPRTRAIGGGGWLPLEQPVVGLRRALTAEFGMAASLGTARRWRRPARLHSMHLAAAVLEVRLVLPCSEMAARACQAEGWLRLMERVAVPVRIRAGVTVDSQSQASLPLVAALRVGCNWDEGAYEFMGEVSVVPSTSCGALALVSYLTNTGFEGRVAILWSHEGRIMRRSGGEIPKGFTMFVDHVKAPVEGLAVGRWMVRLSDAESGRALGEREMLVYDDRSDAPRGALPSLSDYLSFFAIAMDDDIRHSAAQDKVA